MLPLFGTSGIAAYTLWKKSGWTDVWTKYLSFGAVVLLACIANRIIYAADLFMSGDRISEWPFPATQREDAVRKAELATVIGTLFTVAVWLRCGGARHSPGSILRIPSRVLRRMLAWVYTFSVIGILAIRFSPDLGQQTGQLLPVTLGAGVAAAFYLPLVATKARVSRLAMTSLMSIPFLFVALGTGMKEDVILALLPVGYVVLTFSRNILVRVTLILVAAVVLSLITSYVGYFRTQVWQRGRSVDQSQLMSEFLDTAGEEGFMSTFAGGIEGFVGRSNASSYRGWAVSLADEYGYEPDLVFSPMVYVLVPRVLWSNKPLIRQGWLYSGLVFGKEYTSWSDSSTSAGFFSALYLGQGWPAVALGAAFVGALMAGLGALAVRMGGPVMLGLFTFTLVPYALRLDEMWTVGALSAPVINFVYIYVIVRMAKALAVLFDKVPPKGARTWV